MAKKFIKFKPFTGMLSTVHKYGFTLAEVLITLGIIGVVAAITIPSLIANHQKKVTVTKLQKAISVINQVYRLSNAENGELTPAQIADIGMDEYFSTYLEPYIKVSAICTDNYKTCGYSRSYPFKTIQGSQSVLRLVSNTSDRVGILTMDGFVYLIVAYFSGNKNETKGGLIYVDLNGGQGPNRFGKDFFTLEKVYDGGGVQTHGYNLPDSTINKGCSLTTQDGVDKYYCAEKIRRAGWKIEKDYPW